MFFKNRFRRRIIVESVFNGAYSGLDNDAIIKRFPVLCEWRDGIPLRQVKKIINIVTFALRSEIKGKIAQTENGQERDSFKIGLYLEEDEIKTRKVSIMGLIGTLYNTANSVNTTFK